ncbi:MAG TPA: patatin-like phospholipase family protein [Polyangiaceae bacterium]|nr:patatin-like phospholipase family protein [Polyangiaceae bacterium]
MASESAVILAGAVAKGAFEAGALEVLAPRVEALNITHAVGASAGALNASLFAVGLRARAEREVTQALVALWSDAATWHNVVDVNWRDIFSLTGVGTADRVLELMLKACAGLSSASPRRVDVSLVLTALAGSSGNIGPEVATTFEHSVRFQDDELDATEDRERLFRTALASAAFPVLFAPVDVPEVGLCIDGGAVNNAPVRLALSGQGRVDRIIVISPEPLLSRPPVPLSGLNLLGHVAEILINERLYRDLHEAASVNENLHKLERLKAEGVPADAIERVKRELGWQPLEIIQIRPTRPLEGNAFEAFGKPALREAYIKAGRDAAQATLAELS